LNFKKDFSFEGAGIFSLLGIHATSAGWRRPFCSGLRERPMTLVRCLVRRLIPVILSMALLGVAAQRSPSSSANSEQIDKWSLPPRERSKMDDSEIIILKLQAENVIHGWLVTNRPVLLIRYKEDDFDVYIVTGMPANPELGTDTFTVRIRLDKQAAYTQHWQQSTDHRSLFCPAPLELVRRMAAARVMVFEFTAFNASPQIITFDVRGLARHMDDNFDDWRAKENQPGSPGQSVRD
jgi:hypothetical protein